MPAALLGAAISGLIGAATTAVSVGVLGGTFFGLGAANLFGAIGAAFAVGAAGSNIPSHVQERIAP
jgi:hypothetical protein